MTHPARARSTAAALCLVTTAAVAAGCTSDASSETPSRPAGPALSASTGPSYTDGSAAEAILNQAFMGRQPLGSGFGRLQQQVGNTLAGTPDNVRSVTFAFTCTGGATAALTVRAGENDLPSTVGTQLCDGTVYQRSVELPKPNAVSFQAAITGPYDGSFAYAYHVEKKQLD